MLRDGRPWSQGIDNFAMSEDWLLILIFPSIQFKTRHFGGLNLGAITDKFGHLVEHTSVAQRFRSFCFYFYPCLAKLLSLSFYIILLLLKIGNKL